MRILGHIGKLGCWGIRVAGWGVFTEALRPCLNILPRFHEAEKSPSRDSDLGSS